MKMRCPDRHCTVLICSRWESKKKFTYIYIYIYIERERERERERIVRKNTNNQIQNRKLYNLKYKDQKENLILSTVII
jgi:hypothetical protein